MVDSLVLAAAFALQPVQAMASAPTEFEVTCLLVGHDGRQDRFALISMGRGGDQHFAFRGEGAPAWVSQVSAGRVGEQNNFHFVSNGQAYRLDIQFDRPAGGALTARADLYEDRGDNALNLQLAGGSCRGTAESGSRTIPALPSAPAARAVGFSVRNIGMRSGHVPSDCIVVRRDLTTIRLKLDIDFDDQGIRFAVSPQAGQPWPDEVFTLRGASLIAQVAPLSGDRFMNVMASAGTDPSSAAPASLRYDLHAQRNLIEGWLQVHARGNSEFLGSGFCGVDQSTGQHAESQQ